MVKKSSKKKEESGIFQNIKSIYKIDYFQKEKNIRGVVIYLIILLAILLFETYLKSINVASVLNLSEVLLYVGVGIPMFFLFIFSLLYVFINAFKNSKKGFWKSYLIFCAIIGPYLVIGNFFSLLEVFFNITSIVVVLNLFVLFYFLINFILNIKNYFKTTTYRVISSLIVIGILLFNIFIVQYLTILIGNFR